MFPELLKDDGAGNPGTADWKQRFSCLWAGLRRREDGSLPGAAEKHQLEV